VSAIKSIIAAAALTLVLAGCGSAEAASQPPPAKPGDGGNFLSTYVHDLTTAGPHDNACHPSTLAELFTPCDDQTINIHDPSGPR
jgi:hypothetical protein